ncbi:hypothetical protein BH09BAC1_BH09BAC1_26900 [soil metagenome]
MRNIVHKVEGFSIIVDSSGKTHFTANKTSVIAKAKLNTTTGGKLQWPVAIRSHKA